MGLHEDGTPSEDSRITVDHTVHEERTHALIFQSGLNLCREALDSDELLD